MKPVASIAGFVLLIVFTLWRIAPAGAAGCAPPIAMRAHAEPVRFDQAAVAPGTVDLTFLGHASFLLQSPGGVSIVTDYNGYIRPDFIPDVVTMNHAHSTHYTDFPDPGIKLVLRGWDTGEGIPHYNVTWGDVHIRNVSTNIREYGYGAGTEFGGNSIFVFDMGGVCIAHLSHLHHTLTPEHLAELGEIDVLIAPVDGAYTLSQSDMMTVIDQIKPPLIIPMHYFTTRVLEDFLRRTDGHYPIQRVEGHRVTLSRDALPKVPTILVVPPISGG